MVDNSHEPIISLETFERVQAEIERRADKYKHKSAPKEPYPFSRKIVCAKCGKHYRRKTTATGPVWICDTYNSKGKTFCASKAIKMNRAALVFGVGKHFSHGFQHSQALVPNNEFYAIQSTALEPLKEIHPTGLVLFHALGRAQDLTVSVLIHCDCHQNCNIFVLSAPVAPQVDAVHIDVRILVALQRTVPPILNVDIGFLVQLTDGGRRYLAAPQSLGNILHTAHRDAGNTAR